MDRKKISKKIFVTDRPNLIFPEWVSGNTIYFLGLIVQVHVLENFMLNMFSNTTHVLKNVKIPKTMITLCIYGISLDFNSCLMHWLSIVLLLFEYQ